MDIIDSMDKTKMRKRKGLGISNPEKVYPEVENLLIKLAANTMRVYGIPFDDCMSECNYAFVKAANWRFDPTKGAKFTTQVATIAKWRLKSLVIARMQEAPTVEIDEEKAGFVPEVRSETLEAIEDLSEDAREIIALIVESPAELLGQVTTRNVLKRVKTYLRKRRKSPFSRDQITRAEEEIQTRFQQLWATPSYGY